MRIPTFFAFEWLDMVTPTVTAIVGGAIAYLLARPKAKADIHKTETEVDMMLADRFLALLDAVQKLKLDEISAEERRSLERIASAQELAALREQIEQCEVEHEAWMACKTAMMQFLLAAEPALQAFTSQPTLIEAVESLKSQIEAAE